jgi:hypothetical protein
MDGVCVYSEVGITFVWYWKEVRRSNNLCRNECLIWGVFVEVWRMVLNPSNVSVVLCTARFKFKNSTFCPHTVFMCFVWIWEQTAIISLYSINWLVFITETKCVYCAVRTEYVNTIQVKLHLWRVTQIPVIFTLFLHKYVKKYKLWAYKKGSVRPSPQISLRTNKLTSKLAFNYLKFFVYFISRRSKKWILL